MGFGIMALESIDFQDGSFFKALTECIVQIRKNINNSLSDKSIINSKEMQSLEECIKKYTNISIKMNLSGFGAAVMIPKFKNNHILLSDELKDLFDNLNIDSEEDIKKLSKSLKNKKIKGSVDIKRSKIDGIFASHVNEMFINKNILLKDKYLPSEVAAILLHEIGHVFTFFEYSTRMLSTNQALTLINKTIDNRMSLDTKEIVFLDIRDSIGLDKESIDALKKTNSKEEANVIVLNKSIQKNISELGFSLYDYTSCEQLADNFCTRHGAGKDLVTALEKIINDGYWLSVGFYILTITPWFISTPLYTPLIIILTIVISNVINEDGKNIYDNDVSRFERIKHQNTERLKSNKLSVEEKNLYIEQNESINIILKEYKDNKSLIQYLAYYLKPKYRTAKDYEDLQKSLERLASNVLFDKAAKLSTITIPK